MHTHQTRKEHIISVHQAVIEMVYDVRLKRIACGYSRQEVAFFLGYPRAQHKYGEHLIGNKLMADIFGTTIMPSYFNGLSGTEDERQYKMVEYQQGDLFFYEAYEINGDGKEEQLYKLFEKDFEKESVMPEALATLSKAIDTLIANDFFDERRTAIEIFRECHRVAGRNIRPRTLEAVLESLLENGTLLKLKLLSQSKRTGDIFYGL